MAITPITKTCLAGRLVTVQTVFGLCKMRGLPPVWRKNLLNLVFLQTIKNAFIYEI